MFLLRHNAVLGSIFANIGVPPVVNDDGHLPFSFP
jgi:hypothetical protein